MNTNTDGSRPDDAVLDAVILLRVRNYLQYQRLAQRVREIAEDVAGEHLIRCSVQHRIKSVDRLRKKLQSWRDDGRLDGFADAASVLARIGDVAAVRITTYLDRDRNRIEERLRDRLEIVTTQLKDRADSLYRAIHVDVKLLAEDLESSQEDRALEGMLCEVQICTLLSHVYSEIDHDLRYKPLSGKMSADETRLLNALGHLTLTGDQIILSLIERTEERVRAEAHAAPVDSPAAPEAIDIMAALSPKLQFLPRARDNASSVLRLLASIGLRTAQDIEARLIDDDSESRWSELKSLVERHQAENAEQLGTKGAPFSADSADGLLLLAAEKMRPEIEQMLSERGRGRPSREVSIVDELLDGPLGEVA
jgi:ppGpp synthetase/RelA/SpoT-type nucleotidyltranferase